jgi:DNA-binding PadR family transcriptional regulator
MHNGCACRMKGFLSFLILWLLGKKNMSGAELAREIEKRKGLKPNPGTIYPALKELLQKGTIELVSGSEKEKSYALTKKGRKELEAAKNSFCRIFYDVLMK